MKYILFFLLAFGCAGNAFAQDNDPKHKYPKIDGNAPHVLKWDTLTINMGKLHQGIPASVKFEFTNKGTSPAVIKDVHPTCSCTSPEYTRYPVPPGNKGFVIATYNAGAVGKFTKSLAVTTADGEIDILVITGEVEGNGESH